MRKNMVRFKEALCELKFLAKWENKDFKTASGLLETIQILKVRQN